MVDRNTLQDSTAERRTTLFRQWSAEWTRRGFLQASLFFSIGQRHRPVLHAVKVRGPLRITWHELVAGITFELERLCQPNPSSAATLANKSQNLPFDFCDRDAFCDRHADGIIVDRDATSVENRSDLDFLLQENERMNESF
jgi:hypothetical protein